MQEYEKTRRWKELAQEQTEERRLLEEQERRREQEEDVSRSDALYPHRPAGSENHEKSTPYATGYKRATF